MMRPLINSELQNLTDLLNRLEPGNLPPEVFEAIARVTVYPAIEFVPLRKKGNMIEVLLIRRRVDDPVWPNMYHTPGTILRPTDNDFGDAFNRLFTDELNGIEKSEPVYVGAYFSHYARGTGVGFEYVIDVVGEANEGDFFDVTNLPTDLIIEQKPIIQRAVDVYKGIIDSKEI